jgi:hypothetical protein
VIGNRNSVTDTGNTTTYHPNNTYYIYDGEKPIQEYKSDGARAGYNVYGKGIDEILLRADYAIISTAQGYFFQQDRNGNVTHLTGFSSDTMRF